MVNDIDRLFLLKALHKRIGEQVKELDAKCASELSEAYSTEGTTQRRSQFFGKEAGTYTYVEPKEEKRTEFSVSDMYAYSEWLAQNRVVMDAYMLANSQAFCEWLAGETGEVPEGVKADTYTTLKASKPRLAVKEETVLGKLEGNMLEAANRLLIGE